MPRMFHTRTGAAFLLSAIFVAFASFGCGGGSSSTTSPTVTNGVTVNPLHGSMTAVIDGSAWTAVAINTAVYSNGILSIAGADSSSTIRAIGLSVTAPAPGTYSMTTGTANSVLSIGIGPTWTANVAGGSGSVTLTSLSSTGAVGTFSFTAVAAAGGATGSHVVTQGVFNITF